MKVKRYFTLLEVIIALLILSLGVFILLQQLALAARRSTDAALDWNQTHELVNAAEYSLLAGPEARLDARFFDTRRFRIRRSGVLAKLPDGFEHPVSGIQLETLTLRLCNPEGKELDKLTVDCWKDSNAHVQEE